MGVVISHNAYRSTRRQVTRVWHSAGLCTAPEYHTPLPAQLRQAPDDSPLIRQFLGYVVFSVGLCTTESHVGSRHSTPAVSAVALLLSASALNRLKRNPIDGACCPTPLAVEHCVQAPPPMVGWRCLLPVQGDLL